MQSPDGSAEPPKPPRGADPEGMPPQDHAERARAYDWLITTIEDEMGRIRDPKTTTWVRYWAVLDAERRSCMKMKENAMSDHPGEFP